jgi:hypothetical protein
MRASRGVVVVSVLASAACAGSVDPANIKGGQPVYDAALPPSPQAADAGPAGDASTSTKWSDLHAEFFKPKAAASCAGNGACHGSASEPGTISSGGYFCTDDKTQCRQALIAAAMLDKDPAKARLISVIRHRDASGQEVGFMPKASTYSFSAQSIDRISTWLKTGFPDD